VINLGVQGEIGTLSQKKCESLQILAMQPSSREARPTLLWYFSGRSATTPT